MKDAFASLQLPRTATAGSNQSSSLPTLCLLVVADMDLPSASALAEAALTKLPEGGTLVDGILACGPFLSDDTLRQYLQQPTEIPSDSPVLVYAREGLVTGCLSQLESIVCRVAWVPSAAGGNDPSTLFSEEEERRLTPNSRNIHKRHLPLAPGLACCGMGTNSETKDEEAAIEKLLDLAAPVTEQLPGEGALQLERSVAIVLTTSEDESKVRCKRSRQQENNRILLHVDAGPGIDAQFENGVLRPGSLKRRGDYCLVHISLVTTEGEEAIHQWQVKNVELMKMELPERRS